VAAPVVVTPVREPQSFPVVHLHRLGECRGRLTVSRHGVAFAADKGSGNDAFSWRPNAFTVAASQKTMTIRAAGRTYRFESAAARAAARPGQIAGITNAIAELHPAASAPNAASGGATSRTPLSSTR
jgi:hypothetical protein